MDAVAGPYAHFKNALQRIAPTYALIVRSVSDKGTHYEALLSSPDYGLFKCLSTEKRIDSCILMVYNRFLDKKGDKQYVTIAPADHFSKVYAKLRLTLKDMNAEGTFKPIFFLDSWGSMEIRKKKPIKQELNLNYEDIISRSDTATYVSHVTVENNRVVIEGLHHSKITVDKGERVLSLKPRVLQDLNTKLNPSKSLSILKGTDLNFKLESVTWGKEVTKDGKFYLVSNPIYVAS